MPRAACAFVIVVVFLNRSLAEGAEPSEKAAPPYASTSHYEERRVEGWRLIVSRDLLADRDLMERTLTHLRHQLYQITRVVPPAAQEKLQSVAIWVEKCDPHHPCMAYHPDPGWLREHGMNPEKARCVELANAETFLKWTHDQPWMVLHELAHAYHHQFLEQGFDNSEVARAYREAVEKERYQAVLHINGRRDKGYAATNPMEYFAETAEAFFGTNDFYPYVRSELKEHDAAAYALHERMWRAAAE